MSRGGQNQGLKRPLNYTERQLLLRRIGLDLPIDCPTADAFDAITGKLDLPGRSAITKRVKIVFVERYLSALAAQPVVEIEPMLIRSMRSQHNADLSARDRRNTWLAVKREQKRERSELNQSWAQPVSRTTETPEGHAVIAQLPADKFYKTREWRQLRFEAFRFYGSICKVCGTGPTPETPLHVDHVKTRALFPESALDIHNLRILCEDCHMGRHYGELLDVK